MIRQNSLEDKYDKIGSGRLENLRIHHYPRLISLYINEGFQMLTIFQKFQLSEIISHHILSEVSLIK